jgi:hypothetical protein
MQEVQLNKRSLLLHTKKKGMKEGRKEGRKDGRKKERKRERKKGNRLIDFTMS